MEDIESDDDYGDGNYGNSRGFLIPSTDGDLMLHVKSEGKKEEVISVKEIIKMKSIIQKLIKITGLCNECPHRYKSLAKGKICCAFEEET